MNSTSNQTRSASHSNAGKIVDPTSLAVADLQLTVDTDFGGGAAQDGLHGIYRLTQPANRFEIVKSFG